MEAEYLRRGGEHFRQVVALGDGAAWIWTMAGKLYPHATHIVDIYHAREHLTDLAEPPGVHHPRPGAVARRPQRRTGRREHRGDHRRRQRLPARRRQGHRPERKLGYFRNNIHRMHYARFQKLGMFIGSGAIEGGIKAIVVQRAKQSGMHWTVEGADDIIALRCQHASGRWNDFVAPRPAPARPGSGQPSDRHRDSEPRSPPGQGSSPTKLSCTARP